MLGDFDARYELILFPTSTTTQRLGDVEYRMRRDGSFIEIYWQTTGTQFSQKLWAKATELLVPLKSVAEFNSNGTQVEISITYTEHIATGKILSNQGKHKFKTKLKLQTFDGAEVVEILRRMASETLDIARLHLLNPFDRTCFPLVITKIGTEDVEIFDGRIPSWIYQVETELHGRSSKETFYVALKKPFPVLKHVKGPQVMRLLTYPNGF